MSANVAPTKPRNTIIRACFSIAAILVCLMALYFASVHTPFLAAGKHALLAKLPSTFSAAVAPQSTTSNTVSTFSRQPSRGVDGNRFSKFATESKADGAEPAPELGQPEAVCGMTAEESTAFYTIKKTHMINAGTAALKIEIEKFISSASQEEQLAGLFMQVENNGKIALLDFWDREKGCSGYPKEPSQQYCDEKLAQTIDASQALALSKLVTHALALKTPDVYAAAWYACLGKTAEACKNMSARTWAHADANNMTAWLAAAAEARKMNDTPGLESAIRAALAAKSNNTRFPNIGALLETDWMRQQSPSAQFGAAMELSLAPIAQGRLVGDITQYCGLDSVAPQSRQTDCNAITTRYLDNAPHYYGMTHALTLADKWGPNAARVQALRDERDAYQLIQFADREYPKSATGGFGFSCTRMDAQIETVINELKIGQRAVAKTHFAFWQKTPAQILGGARRIEDAGRPNGK